jgi:hypothetical protein
MEDNRLPKNILYSDWTEEKESTADSAKGTRIICT